MDENSTTSKSVPQISLKYLFNHTSDLAGTQRFYSELIGLKESQYNLEWGFLCYQCEGFEMMYFAREREEPESLRDWAAQPGYEGGKLEITSWAIKVPEAEFAAIVRKLKNEKVKSFKDVPEWRQQSYWGFTVMDPNGMTVEVFTIPKEKPVLLEWIET